MKCPEARQLIKAHLDGEVAPAEVEALRAHLAGCGECAADFGLERALTAALRESIVTVVAPEGFARGVTAAIGERRRGRAAGWFAGWRPALAGAAAALLIAAGALGYGAQQWLERGPVVAHDPPGAGDRGSVQLPGPGPTGTESPTPGGEAEPGTPGGRAGHTGTQAEPGQVPGATGAPGGTRSNGSSGAGAPAPEPGRTQVAVAPVEPKVFLNKPRIMESTLIKLDVDDLVRARDTALLLSGDVGASCWPQVAQTNGAPVEVLRFNVDPAQAGFFVNKLIGLGQVSERRSDTRDITAEFAERLEQYRGLLAQRPRVTDPGEAATLDGRIASLEWQLTEWDREAGQHVVVLVLQQKT